MRLFSKKSLQYWFYPLVFILCFTLGGVQAEAREVTTVDSLLKAISTNPEVLAKWYSFSASERELGSARGGFRPRLDLTAGIGREYLDGQGYAGRDFQEYTRNGVSLSLTQMIFDGNYTSSRVKKLSHAQKMRYYDLLSSMEQVALAALRSHEDMIRYRTLVEMARENMARHEEIKNKVQERTAAGVDSQVNLETAKGRLALARVNLMTEESNLHDSGTQYVRVVGENPGAGLEKSAIDLALPGEIDSSMEKILADNPLVCSHQEQVNSMSYAVSEQRSKMSPRLDFRASANFENDVDGVRGHRDKRVVELILRYNLYNGGSDKADIERYGELLKESEENKNRAERDVRQIALVSFNDVRTLSEQLESLDQHRQYADHTRNAYGKQFEAGRRSLLDLLDAENEYFQANRAYVNAESNLTIAKARYLAASGQLLKYFNVFGDSLPSPEEIRLEIVKDKVQ